MPLRIAALLVTSFLAAGAGRCLAQDAGGVPGSGLTREQWQQRIEAARRRSADYVATVRTQPAEPPPPLDESKEATDRAMNDPTLQQGDIVATSKGLVVFVGRDEQHQPADFQPARDRPSPR
ncbi:MAG: hypothetical protein JOY90_34310 [Bradyrhizobium sp.]|uniref:hypothetical protein n=1 Tax=Bradyrhizobium sp. TaxID=376 RepID=UPI001DA176C5|nr:hypothetical protein [Bradyrhizobium sp.]MBV9565488.1 hypothetical protein [Bradyrhizobium sp.]